MRVVMRKEKELAKAGQDRVIPLTVATALAKDIKDFLDHEAPLMLLMSTPGIKKVRTGGVRGSCEEILIPRSNFDCPLPLRPIGQINAFQGEERGEERLEREILERLKHCRK